jgi:ankyrin repeat protein
MDILLRLPYVPQKKVLRYHAALRKQYSQENAGELFEYIKGGDLPGIENLRRNGMDFNYAIYNNYYPIGHVLLKLDINYNLLEYLLKNGADPNLICPTERGNLSKAVIRNSSKCVKLLLKYGADVNYKYNENGFTALYTAVLLRDYEMVKECLAAGADKNISVNGRTPQDLALFLNEIEITNIIRIS